MNISSLTRNRHPLPVRRPRIAVIFQSFLNSIEVVFMQKISTYHYSGSTLNFEKKRFNYRWWILILVYQTTTIDESSQARVWMRVFSTLIFWSNEKESHERWQARVCIKVFSTLMPLSNENMQELHESWWELTSESLYERFLNSHVLVKREQELLHKNWWELTSESLYKSFLNSRVLVKREQELRASWL